MDPSSVPEQSTHPNLSLAKVQKLETLGLHYNLPEEAIICTKCGFALSPKRASEHPGKKHGIARSARHGLKHLLSSLNLPDPDTLAPRPNGSRRHPYLTVQQGLSCKHCGLHSASGKVLEDHPRAEHRDKLKLTAEKISRQHWLRDHIQQEVLFQSWTANNTRRSWLVSTDNDVNSRSIPSSIHLQASPDPIKLLAQKLFTEEYVRLENQQSGGRRSYGQETPASSALQTNWLRRTGWETTFRKARCDVLVRLMALPHSMDNRPLSLGVVEGEAIISPACDERRLSFMMAALDPLHRQHFTLRERQDISNQILEIPNIIKDADDLQNWKFPSPDIEPIPYLEPPLHGGLGCNSCPHIGRDLRRIREHYRRDHSDVLEANNSVDLSRLGQQSHLWRNNITYQRMFRSGQKRSWFEVGRPRIRTSEL